jgi:predicted ATPase
MITNLTLEGFKSFVSDSLDLGKLTVLTGMNSSGKSSVIQALLMIKYAHMDGGNKLSWFLEGHGDDKELTNSYCDSFQIAAQFNNGQEVICTNHYAKASKNPASPINITYSALYIGANRFGSENMIPVYHLKNDLGERGENLLNFIDYHANEPLSKTMKHPDSEGDTFLYNLRAWLGVISPNTKFDYEIHKLMDSSFATFNGHRAKNVGFGLSYVLSVIAVLLWGSLNPNSLIMIENPEAHLHPRGQTEIAKLIAKCAEAGAQVIVETHSDHIFDGIRIYAKESQNNFHEQVKAYWFELNKKGFTEVESVEIDKNGRIVGDMPQGMFDQFIINASKLL